jgi:hypothetical protein
LLALVDRVAALTEAGDHGSIAELLSLAGGETRLRPPADYIERALRVDASGDLAGNPITSSA